MTHITEENGIASNEFLVKMKFLISFLMYAFQGYWKGVLLLCVTSQMGKMGWDEINKSNNALT